jgi:HD-like signal output (HDOD) protein
VTPHAANNVSSCDALPSLVSVRTALEQYAARREEASHCALVQRAAHALQAPERSLPRLPEAVIQAAKVVDSPRCDVLDLADTLNAEPSVASRVAAIANSAFFAGPEPVYTARDAIVRMGIRETRNVVMGLALRDLFLEGPGYSRQRRELWHHSLAAAACAQGILCEIAFDDSSGFLAGLAHDLGRAAVFTWASEIEGGPPAAESVVPLADALHAELGALILQHWRLGNDLVQAVRWHHRALESGVATALALEAADRLARQLTDTSGRTPVDPGLDPLLSALDLDRHRVTGIVQESRARLDELLKIL